MTTPLAEFYKTVDPVRSALYLELDPKIVDDAIIRVTQAAIRYGERMVEAELEMVRDEISNLLHRYRLPLTKGEDKYNRGLADTRVLITDRLAALREGKS